MPCLKYQMHGTARQQRHLSFLSSFTTDIEHIIGKDNVVPDCLSRAAISNASMEIDYVRSPSSQRRNKGTVVPLQTFN